MQTRALVMGAAGLGLALLARSWRTFDACDFSGKTVLITGGSRGLGLVLARRLVEEGASVVLVARNRNDLERAADDLKARHPGAVVHTVAADLRRQPEAVSAVGEAVERTGRLDVLVNNAGVIQMGPFDNQTVADFDDGMAVHFWAPLYLTMAAVPHMRRQGGGRIVNISSIGGRVAVPHLLPYCASKFALAGLSDGLRAELARDRIVVTSVFPGLMRTGSPINALFKGKRTQEYAWFAVTGSLPVTTINAERAAGQIVEACRRGDAELVITVQAKLAILARTLAPEIVGDLLAVMNRVLPAPSADGQAAERGREHESPVAGPRSPLTALTYAAARRNNEM